MDAQLMAKLGQMTKAERPYSSEGIKSHGQKVDKGVFSGLCNLTKEKRKDKYSAHLRKPDPREEILILISILKKGIKVLCRHGQNRSGKCCISPDYDQIHIFIDTSKRLVNFKEHFLTVFSGRNSFCCYSKLIKELKTIRYCFSKELEKNYCLYKSKIDLINCLIACFRSLENKICFVMAGSNDHDDCEQGCEARQSSCKLSKISSKASFASSKTSQKKSSVCSSLKKHQIEDPCECSFKNLQHSVEHSKNPMFNVVEHSKCQVFDNVVHSKCPMFDNVVHSNAMFDMTLEYYKYKIGDNPDSSSDEEVDTFEQELPNGYVKSKIYKKDDTVSLSVKCITKGDESGIMCLKYSADSERNRDSEKSVKLMKIADDMSKLLNMSKDWYNSGMAVCQHVLKKS